MLAGYLLWLCSGDVALGITMFLTKERGVDADLLMI